MSDKHENWTEEDEARMAVIMNRGPTGEHYENAFSLVTDDDAKAYVMSVKNDLMLNVRDKIRESGMTQKQAAECLGIFQPRVSDIMNGRLERFSLEMLTLIEFKVRNLTP